MDYRIVNSMAFDGGGFAAFCDSHSQFASESDTSDQEHGVFSAAVAANAAINYAPIPVLHLRRPDIRHQARFPFVLGGFDNDIIAVDWHHCNGQNICDIFISKMFGSGRGAQKSMGVWARELMKFLSALESLQADSAILGRIEAVLKCTRSALQSEDFEPLLQAILCQVVHLAPARGFLTKYSRQHVLHVVSKTFFPQVTDVQVAQCRFYIFILFIITYFLC